MQETNRMLIIIPKADRTIIGIYHEERCIFKDKLPFIKKNQHLEKEVDNRQRNILEKLNEAGINLSKLTAVSAIGGLLRPVEGGAYLVNDAMISDLANSYNGKHASNLGGIIAASIAADLNIPAFIVDPPVVDEMDSVARYSGYQGIERKSIFHALNQKASARRVAHTIGIPYQNANLIVAHIGNGISIAAHQQGRVIDVNNGLHGDGPFSLERAGTLPSADLIDLCYDNSSSKEDLVREITYQGGLKGYLGVNNVKEMQALLHEESLVSKEIIQAMGYQISKEIGAMATVLTGNVDAVVLTGEFANIEILTDYIVSQVNWIGDVFLYPGEADLQALNAGTLRVLRNEETPKRYGEKKKEGADYDERI